MPVPGLPRMSVEEQKATEQIAAVIDSTLWQDILERLSAHTYYSGNNARICIGSVSARAGRALITRVHPKKNRISSVSAGTGPSAFALCLHELLER